MNCPSRESLSEYFDGRSGKEASLGLELHLAGCGECKTSLALLRAIKLRLAALPPPDCPEELLAELSESARALPSPPPSGAGSFAWSFAAALALGAVLLRGSAEPASAVPGRWLEARHVRFAAALPLSEQGLVPEEAPFDDD